MLSILPGLSTAVGNAKDTDPAQKVLIGETTCYQYQRAHLCVKVGNSTGVRIQGKSVRTGIVRESFREEVKK